MYKNILIFSLIVSIALGFVGCTKNTVPEPSGNCKLYISGIQFQEFMASGPVEATVNIKFYTATDTSTSLVITERSDKFIIGNPNDHDQILGYNLSEGIQQMDVAIYFDMGDYAAKKLSIENIALVYKGDNLYNEVDILKSSTTYTSVFILEPFSVDF